MRKTAAISECGQFRYMLARQWADGPSLTFVMLNPSTADAEQDDATVRKCIGFAKQFGYSGLRIANLFAFRARDPADLRRSGWPVGPENDEWLAKIGDWAWANNEPIVCAWGAHARGHAGRRRIAHVLSVLQRRTCDLRALLVLADGTPSHPLMLPYSCKLEPFNVVADLV